MLCVPGSKLKQRYANFKAHTLSPSTQINLSCLVGDGKPGIQIENRRAPALEFGPTPSRTVLNVLNHRRCRGLRQTEFVKKMPRGEPLQKPAVFTSSLAWLSLNFKVCFQENYMQTSYRESIFNWPPSLPCSDSHSLAASAHLDLFWFPKLWSNFQGIIESPFEQGSMFPCFHSILLGIPKNTQRQKVRF